MVKTVYTFMVADLFHANHVRFLELASTYGDKLIVGVLTDEAVKLYKRTPIYPLEERIIIMEAIKFVDMVVIQESRSPLEMVKLYKPDVLVHSDGWEYDPQDMEEFKLLNMEIIFTSYFKGVSTTSAIKKCQEIKTNKSIHI